MSTLNPRPYFCCGNLPTEGHTTTCLQQNDHGDVEQPIAPLDGKAQYELDCANRPTYAGDTPRLAWEQLHPTIQANWTKERRVAQLIVEHERRVRAFSYPSELCPCGCGSTQHHQEY